MITKEYLERHFKFHNKLVLYTKDNVKLEFTKEPHFHMKGGYHTMDLMDLEDLEMFCNMRGLQLKQSEDVTE